MLTSVTSCLTATLLLASAIPSVASIPASKVLYNSSVVRVPPAHRTIRTVSLSTIAWDADLSPPPLPPPPRPVMGAQQAGGATYFTVCAPFSSDDPGQFYYNNTKDGNSTSPWIPFAKHPTWVGDVYTSRPWFQTGLYYYDIKFSGAGVEVVSNERAADAHGPANCSAILHRSRRLQVGVSATSAVQSWGALASAIARLPTSASKTASFVLGSGFTMAGYNRVPNGTVITIPKGCAVTITSESKGKGTGRTVLDAGSKGSLFIVRGSLNVNGLILQNGVARGVQGVNGGAFSTYGSAAFTSCSFINNTAPDGDGGVAHVYNTATATFTSCSFAKNAAHAGGGAVDVYLGSARFVNCSFEVDSKGTDLKYNGIYDGGKIVFGCPAGTTGNDVPLKGSGTNRCCDRKTSQLPPAQKIASCHPLLQPPAAPPLAVARQYLGVGVLNGTLYAMGGMDEDVCGIWGKLCPPLSPYFASVEARRDHQASGDVVVANMSVPRSLLGVCALDGMLFAVGGAMGRQDGEPVPLASVEAYHPGNDTWALVEPMTATREGPGVGALGGLLYAVGGRSDDGQTLPTVEAYDPATNTWDGESIAPMLFPRHDFGVGVLGGVLYAVGGANGKAGTYLSSVEAYHPANNTWTLVAPMSVIRVGMGVGVLEGLLYAVGGHSIPTVGTLASVEAYNPATNRWTRVASMSAKRQDLGVGVLGGKLYAVGGFNLEDGYLASVEVYNPANDSWN